MQRILLAAVIISFWACSSDEDPVDCEKSGPVINLENVTNATSCSSNDGAISVSVSGGKEPYIFMVNDQLTESAGEISNLSAGSYSVVVRDANNCIKAIDNVTILAEDFSFTATFQPNTSCLAGNGSVTIDVVSTNPPYEFRLGNGSFSDVNTFSDLKTGSHLITVQDNNNCMVTLQITVPKGNTATSWANEVRPILEKNCAISGCHNGVSRVNDFRKFQDAKTYAADIKSMTQDRSMPFDGTLTQTEINLIACWVDDGAIQN
jgi:hypothetical protein